MKSKLISKILSFFDSHLGPGSTVYSILKPCYRCVYAKRYEPVLIVSKTRGPRIIVNLDGKTYVRKGQCLGKECPIYCECWKAIEREDLPCKWKPLNRI